MAISLDMPPLDISYRPQHHPPSLPLEVVTRSNILSRISNRELSARQRIGFHQLVVGTSGAGSHVVDFETVDLRSGTVLMIHPGQVQQFVVDGDLEAVHVVWPIESHHADPGSPRWFPGTTVPTKWQLDIEMHARLLGWISELSGEIGRFDGSSRRIQLMQALLCAMLLRLSLELPHDADIVGQLPEPYLRFRAELEGRLYERPTVAELAYDLGYSSRTLDRACKTVAGLTARQVLDERLALEVRRLLTHTARSFHQIALDLGFGDQSNFSKFVKRHLGGTPSQVRDGAVAG